MTDKKLHRHVFCFNEEDNGGEAVMLTTDFFANGDPGVVYMNQEFELQSYCNSASITLCGAQLTPELLRKLADELVEARLIAGKKCDGHE